LIAKYCLRSGNGLHRRHTAAVCPRLQREDSLAATSWPSGALLQPPPVLFFKSLWGRFRFLGVGGVEATCGAAKWRRQGCLKSTEFETAAGTCALVAARLCTLTEVAGQRLRSWARVVASGGSGPRIAAPAPAASPAVCVHCLIQDGGKPKYQSRNR